ncbi:FAD-dependent oxidoreductase [Congregibacter brevis]|uniref:FAD-dependent oxidoreductase n=1 Tax=Congregibacter brevis TaxID=3081201 RepID=A0ABZ0I8V6_9GAMM|nr:FAD-dependent oxidoreductase [Congregibacter sp. IMCC45268]
MNYDIVIVGAGIIGLNIAYQCARRGNLRILVLERGAGVGEGSTGASSAACRHRYSADDLTVLARDGINAYRHWQEYLALDATRASFQNEGVLWMPCDNGEWAHREFQRLGDLGIRSEILTADETSDRFPAFATCTRYPDLITGNDHPCDHGGFNLFEKDGGYIDPVSAAQDLVDALRERGVELRFNTQLVSIQREDGGTHSMTLANGDIVNTALVVNAAGPWCESLNTMAGFEHPWSLTPTRIQVFHLDRPSTLEGQIPVTVDTAGGIYFRTQNRGQQLIVSSILEADEEEVVENADDFSRETDDTFGAQKLHALQHRLPGLDLRTKPSGYCGLYTINRQDVHPVLGPTSIEGYWVANGFSGHGFKLAPAIGAMVARGLLGEIRDFDTEVPLSFLSVNRTPLAVDSLSVMA